jgi:galactokinase
MTSALTMEVAFESYYGKAARWVARAPGRVNLIGEHTDYNDGFVLPMAIERNVEIAAATNDSNRVTLRSTALDEVVHIDLTSPIQPEPKGRWANYPKGVLAGFIHAGYRPPGLDVLIHSTVPMGGGLSSSAALEVAFATLLEAIVGTKLDPVDKALLCRRAEHDYAHVPCGLMDQFICTLAREDHLLLLDCRSQETQWIEFADPTVTVLILDTHVKHELASGEYRARHGQCEVAAKVLGVPSLREATREQLEEARERMDSTIFRRARHVVGENIRTVQAALAIRKRDWLEVGQLMYASHQSLQEDFEVSCRELDAVVQIAQSIGPSGGMIGCRMTGGGFGGCAVALIETQAHAAVARTMKDEYEALTGIEPALFVSRPAQGAALIHVGEAAVY